MISHEIDALREEFPDAARNSKTLLNASAGVFNQEMSMATKKAPAKVGKTASKSASKGQPNILVIFGDDIADAEANAEYEAEE